ncbi:MAG: hypothetical protein DHS20C21_12070 [Gemmatimonadota bacterium]|nr:MAG: hypothetical protein DHS20C21_12070 [Gemmatimonadota bacterium]
MFRAWSALLILSLAGADAAQSREFLRGADVSFLPQVEAGGGVFRDDGAPTDLFALLRSRGLNSIRLRLWHSPENGHSGLAEALSLADRAHAAGFDLMLDLHYSDTWADPSNQSKPAEWAQLPMAALADSVRAYTRDTLLAFVDRGVPPAIVQLGNEIGSGTLWNDGRVGRSFDTPMQWMSLAALLQAATAGVREAFPDGARPEIMIHIDRGGDNEGARWFYDNLAARGVDFDLIGLSFYPWWHGTLADLQLNLKDLALRYDKDIVVVETAYPWTQESFDDLANLVGPADPLLPGFPASPEGQHAFLAVLLDLVQQVPGGRGRGVYWWAPEWICTPTLPSAYDNLTLFDENGNALPALRAWSATPPPPRTGDPRPR